MRVVDIIQNCSKMQIFPLARTFRFLGKTHTVVGTEMKRAFPHLGMRAAVVKRYLDFINAKIALKSCARLPKSVAKRKL